MTSSALPVSDLPILPVCPSAEVWLAMSAADRQRFIDASCAALEKLAELSPEGRPHSTAKMRAISVLDDFMQRVGRQVFLAAELPVLYPGETAFAPDLIAVRDVPDLGDQDPHMAWSVAEEGRGIDLAMEILHAGDRNKDLIENVARFARLGIPEYFVYDRRHQRLYGYRLPPVGPRRYQSISSRSSRLRSEVLDLELGIVDGRLRFFYGEAMVPEARELISRLDTLLDQRERQIEEEIALRKEAEERAAAEKTRVDELSARLEAEERARAALEAELAQLRAKLAEQA